jgi:hypothetical protein
LGARVGRNIATGRAVRTTALPPAHRPNVYAHLAPDAGAELISALEPSNDRRGNGVATS